MGKTKVARISNTDSLSSAIVGCSNCPRLIKHCQKIAQEKRAAYLDQSYWGKPVPNFGNENAQVIILGLAPAAHGANRTGRMFTGDRSGEWLYRALYRAGFANQAESTGINDGLTLKNCLVTAVAHCAPPDNKPTPKEIENCRPFLNQLLSAGNWKVIVALGGIAWTHALKELKSQGENFKAVRFSHGAELVLAHNRVVLASYHPSQQNTFTGRLTEPMLDQVIGRAATRAKQLNRQLMR